MDHLGNNKGIALIFEHAVKHSNLCSKENNGYPSSGLNSVNHCIKTTPMQWKAPYRCGPTTYEAFGRAEDPSVWWPHPWRQVCSTVYSSYCIEAKTPLICEFFYKFSAKYLCLLFMIRKSDWVHVVTLPFYVCYRLSIECVGQTWQEALHSNM